MPIAIKHRCHWCTDDPIYLDYHDHEWGIPLHDDIRLFEMLVLEGAQAGLSWLTILKKRQNYRRAFEGFRPEIVAAYGPKEIDALLHDPGIIRNGLKIKAAIQNARQVLEIQAEFGSLDSYLWNFVGGKPIRNAWKDFKGIPSQSRESDLMSVELKKRGFKFVGTKICYAFIQAVGMVNDHEVSCFRHEQVKKLAGK
jgi:DNA-3-methyladenine glycosylase I